jgi:hypothetical protein
MEITPAVKRLLERTAHDASIGAGNDSETPDWEAATRALGHAPSTSEVRAYRHAWTECLQMMAQP